MRLEVNDTGHGIPPGILPQIFDPFFTTKPIGEGTGLGLSTVAGIARNHGGFVRVNSTPGAGSKFMVFLPAIPDGSRRLMQSREWSLYPSAPDK